MQTSGTLVKQARHLDNQQSLELLRAIKLAVFWTSIACPFQRGAGILGPNPAWYFRVRCGDDKVKQRRTCGLFLPFIYIILAYTEAPKTAAPALAGNSQDVAMRLAKNEAQTGGSDA